MRSSAGLHNGRKGDPLPLADLGCSQHLPSESRLKYCNYLSLRNITPLTNRHAANLESLFPALWTTLEFLVTPFMLCTITSFLGDMFSLSLWIRETSHCLCSPAIVTRPALSRFASYLDSSKFFISPSMLAFFGSTFPLNLQLWNTIRMRWNIVPLQCRRNFDPLWLC